MTDTGQPSERSATRRAVPYVLRALVGLFVAFYLAQYWWLAPNHTDDGLILTYIEEMARGYRPHWDFIDAYGLLNWLFPVLFYSAAGQKVWGIRLWLWLLKLVCVATTWTLVRRLTNRLYAALAVVWMTVLIGQPWQSMQTAYAFVNVVPLVLGAWYFILVAPYADSRQNVSLAAVLTTAAIWTKLNTGMFLFAGGLFSYFYWLGERSGENDGVVVPEQSDTRAQKRAKWFLVARLAGLVAYGLLFLAFTRRHFDTWFFLYLIVPLLFVLTFTGHHCFRRREAPAPYLRPFLRYLVTTSGLSLAVWFGYYRQEAFKFASELAGILRAIDYTAAFPDLGKPGMYVGLNEYFWLQWPLFLAVVYAVWVALSAHGAAAFGESWQRRRAVATSIVALIVLHSFVMYARADETHIFQVLLFISAPLFILLHQIESLVRTFRPAAARYMRFAVGGGAVIYASTIAVVPTFDVFNLHAGEWHNPKLEYIRYRPEPNPYVKNFSPYITDWEWDLAEDQTAEFIDSITVNDEEILMLTANRLMHYNSNTAPIGGRYHFLFYLASVGLINRAAFDELAPPGLLRDVLTHPPRIMVSCEGRIPPLILVFPEFRGLRDRWYVPTGKYRHILVYELRIGGHRKANPWRVRRPRSSGD